MITISVKFHFILQIQQPRLAAYFNDRYAADVFCYTTVWSNVDAWPNPCYHGLIYGMCGLLG